MNIAASAEAINFQAIFEAMPGSFIVVQPDEPYFTVLAVSDELLQLTSYQKSGSSGQKHLHSVPRKSGCNFGYRTFQPQNSLQNALRI